MRMNYCDDMENKDYGCVRCCIVVYCGNFCLFDRSFYIFGIFFFFYK